MSELRRIVISVVSAQVLGLAIDVAFHPRTFAQVVVIGVVDYLLMFAFVHAVTT